MSGTGGQVSGELRLVPARLRPPACPARNVESQLADALLFDMQDVIYQKEFKKQS